jgi:hypothetical protein
MLEKFEKLIDVKSIVTLSIIFTMVYVVISGRPIDEKTFLLFSNVATMIVTYFFTKKEKVE